MADFTGIASFYHHFYSAGFGPNGHIVCQDAWANHDGKKVPLVWADTKDDVIGTAELHNTPDGLSADITFFDNLSCRLLKTECVINLNHKIMSLDIYGTRLQYFTDVDGIRHITGGKINYISVVPYNVHGDKWIVEEETKDEHA